MLWNGSQSRFSIAKAHIQIKSFCLHNLTVVSLLSRRITTIFFICVLPRRLTFYSIPPRSKSKIRQISKKSVAVVAVYGKIVILNSKILNRYVGTERRASDYSRATVSCKKGCPDSRDVKPRIRQHLPKSGDRKVAKADEGGELIGLASEFLQTAGLQFGVESLCPRAISRGAWCRWLWGTAVTTTFTEPKVEMEWEMKGDQ